MRKKLLNMAVVAIVFAAAIIMSSSTVHAVEWETVTFEGVVTRPDGTPVPNVMVMVDCLDGPSEFTDAKGHYVIKGSAHLCLGDSIAVFTYIRYSPNLDANDAATLLDETVYSTTDPNKINRADIQMGRRTVPVPEYSWIGGLVATGGGMGIIMHIRYLRKQTSRSA